MSQRISPAVLRTFAAGVLSALGVPEHDAALVADSLVQADLWGHQSHGILRLPWYTARLRSGAMSPRTDPVVVSDTGPLVLLDGKAGVGQVLADTARRLAVERAGTHGVGVVGVRDSNHFGTAMYYTRRAARQGYVALLMTNSSPAIAPWGGRQKVIGSNPWSIAAPGPHGRLLMVDVANTAVARGKLYLAQSRGEAIPPTWALGPDGTPTTDPAEGILGMILPMGGHKGYAISFMIDVLTGALTGSGVASSVHGPYKPAARSCCGHLFMALDVRAFGDEAGYTARIAQLMSEVKNVPLAPGFDGVLYPGEYEQRAEAAAVAAGGIALPAQTRDNLMRLATETGVALNLADAAER